MAAYWFEHAVRSGIERANVGTIASHDRFANTNIDRLCLSDPAADGNENAGRDPAVRGRTGPTGQGVPANGSDGDSGGTDPDSMVAGG